MEFGQEVDIISDGVAYRSILTGRERGKNTKLVFGTVRLDLPTSQSYTSKNRPLIMPKPWDTWRTLPLA